MRAIKKATLIFCITTGVIPGIWLLLDTYGGYKIVEDYDKAANMRVVASVHAVWGSPYPLYGCARICSRMDENGKVSEVIYLDKDGHPFNYSRYSHVSGYAMVAFSYNTRGDLISEAFFDSKGDLANNASGYAKGILTYDDAGKIQSKVSFRADGTAAYSDVFRDPNRKSEVSQDALKAEKVTFYDSISDLLREATYQSRRTMAQSFLIDKAIPFSCPQALEDS